MGAAMNGETAFVTMTPLYPASSQTQSRRSELMSRDSHRHDATAAELAEMVRRGRDLDEKLRAFCRDADRIAKVPADPADADHFLRRSYFEELALLLVKVSGRVCAVLGQGMPAEPFRTLAETDDWRPGDPHWHAKPPHNKGVKRPSARR
jgi:hypothetical protein